MIEVKMKPECSVLMHVIYICIRDIFLFNYLTDFCYFSWIFSP